MRRRTMSPSESLAEDSNPTPTRETSLTRTSHGSEISPLSGITQPGVLPPNRERRRRSSMSFALAESGCVLELGVMPIESTKCPFSAQRFSRFTFIGSRQRLFGIALFCYDQFG